MAVLESKIERKIVAWLHREGWWAEKLHLDSKRGFPDVTAVKNNIWVLFEVKRPGGVVAKHQKQVHKDLRKAGAQVFVVESLEEVQAIVGGLCDSP